MRKIYAILGVLLLTASGFSQSPEKISYQAVIRNSSDQLVRDMTVGMQISILQGSASGTALYIETHAPTTNANGLVSIEIGGGSVVSGNFAAIDWADGPYFLQTEIDPSGGTDYTITGTSQLLSVPYAFHSNTADSVAGGITETDPLFTAWDRSTGISVTESQVSDLGDYIESETQNLDDVLTHNNSAGNKNITDLADPVNAQDAVTKSYVTLEVSSTGDTLFLGPEQWIIIPGISAANSEDEHTGTFTDSRDGNTYKYVTIGNQVWMAENLKYLPDVVDPDIRSTTVPRYYVFIYNGNDVDEAKATSFFNTYGVLYNWPAAMEACPTGWNLPTDEEWTELTDYLGGEGVAGGKLKEAGTNHWQSPNTGATNETGFTALPGGHLHLGSIFDNLGYTGIWWTSTESEITDIDYLMAWYRGMSYNRSAINRSEKGPRQLGFSVRCVRD